MNPSRKQALSSPPCHSHVRSFPRPSLSSPNVTPSTVTAEEEIRYTEIIDGILATADLETVTRKKIRSGLQAQLGGRDLNEQRVTRLLTIPARYNVYAYKLHGHPLPFQTPPES